MKTRERLIDKLDALSCYVEAALEFIHMPGRHTLYVRPDGSVFWHEELTDFDNNAQRWRVCSVGAGDKPCACECCAQKLDAKEWGFDTEQDVYIADEIEMILRDFIPQGWFEDKQGEE